MTERHSRGWKDSPVGIVVVPSGLLDVGVWQVGGIGSHGSEVGRSGDVPTRRFDMG
jgi:hypothetical protein